VSRLLMLSVLVAACVTPSPVTRPVLLRATLENVQQGGLVQPDANVALSLTFRLKFRVSEVLIGSYRRAAIVATVEQDSKPKDGYEYYLLVVTDDGRDEVVWRGIVDDGLCVSYRSAMQYSILEELRAQQRKHPCRYGSSLVP
jgi:hypothetical protein